MMNYTYRDKYFSDVTNRVWYSYSTLEAMGHAYAIHGADIQSEIWDHNTVLPSFMTRSSIAAFAIFVASNI